MKRRAMLLVILIAVTTPVLAMAQTPYGKVPEFPDYSNVGWDLVVMPQNALLAVRSNAVDCAATASLLHNLFVDGQDVEKVVCIPQTQEKMKTVSKPVLVPYTKE
jgi:hypothetical protein